MNKYKMTEEELEAYIEKLEADIHEARDLGELEAALDVYCCECEEAGRDDYFNAAYICPKFYEDENFLKAFSLMICNLKITVEIYSFDSEYFLVRDDGIRYFEHQEFFEAAFKECCYCTCEICTSAAALMNWNASEISKELRG